MAGEDLSAALRLARDPLGEDLVLTLSETEAASSARAESEAQRADLAMSEAAAAKNEGALLRAEIEKLHRG